MMLCPLSRGGEDEDILPENHPKMAAFQHAVKQALERQLDAITEQIRQAEKTLLIRYSALKNLKIQESH
jgi:hypothetical protein